MRLDLYQAETAQIAQDQTVLLNEARDRLLNGMQLSALEKNGVLHAFQILIENSIGKAKQILKSEGEVVPVSAYDAFAALVRLKYLSSSNLNTWNVVIGVRNRIVHEYMNVDMDRILDMIKVEQYRFVSDFLLTQIDALKHPKI